MPMLEIFDILEKVYGRFCECFYTDKHKTSLRNVRYTNRRNVKKNRRQGGQENSLLKRKQEERCFRRYYSDTSTSDTSFHSFSEFQAITDYSLPYHRRIMPKASVPVGNNRSIGLLPLPNSFIQSPVRSASGYLPESHPRLLLLRQQSLRENIRMAFQKHSSSLQQKLIHCVYNIIQQFRMVSNSAELAILNNGSSPIYKSTSAAMHLIDIDQIRQRLNNAIIDYLLIDDDTLVNPASITR